MASQGAGGDSNESAVREQLLDDLRQYHDGLLSRYRELVSRAANGKAITNVHDAVETIKG